MASKVQFRIQDELESLTKIVTRMRVQFEREVADWEKTGNFRTELIKIARELTTTMEALLSLRIRFDKAQKELADEMTPEQERAAVIAYLRSLNAEERKSIFIGANYVSKGPRGRPPKNRNSGEAVPPDGPESGVRLLSEELEDEQVGGGDSESPVL